MFRNLIIVAALGAAAAVTAWAEDRSTSRVPAEERVSAAANDCARSPAKRHDHTAERNYGPTTAAAKAETPMPCAPAGNASEPTIKSKAKGHNHTTFHKTL
jgi:hypothetical protein